jgi:[mycofactocin precursor peptide]-tyrosine decarboxylase / 3-amino-5-[(4-hydroxyphenyl)methyl]-4,4-dimethylpyrrolidin-2-one synthase
VRGFGEQALAARTAETAVPRSEVDHSRSAPVHGRAREGGRGRGPVPVSLAPPPRRPDRACDASPLAGMPAAGA